MVIITMLFLGTDSLDSMYVSYIPRNIISKVKITSIIYLEILVVSIEFISLILIGFFIFPYFKIVIEDVYIYIYIMMFGLVDIGISVILVTLISSNFIAMLGFIISFMLQIIGYGFKDKIEYIEYIIPINYNELNIPYISLGIFIFSIII